MLPKHLLLIPVMLAVIVMVLPVMAIDLSLDKESISLFVGDNDSITLSMVSPIDDQLIVSVAGEKPWMVIPAHIPVQANVLTNAKIFFSPYLTTPSQLYKMILTLESQKTNESVAKNISAAVRSTEVAIEKLILSGALEPNGYAELEILIKNYDNVSRNVRLDLAAGPTALLSTTEQVTLTPKEFTIVKKGFSVPECQPSGVYYANARVFSKGVLVFYAEDNFTIPQKPMITKTRNESAFGLRSITTITVGNIGNMEGQTEVSEDIFGSLFFSGDKPTRINGTTYTWDTSVKPCSSVIISYSLDYTPVPLIIILIFAIWYVFFHVRTVRVSKRILQKQVIERGTEFTVGVDVKAYSPVKNIEIRDFVPMLFEVRDAPGVRPIKNKTIIGTELIWRFKEFSRNEERILTYKIIPHFSVTGKVVLPSASITCRHLGRTLFKRSDKTWLGLHLPKPEKFVEEPKSTERIKHVMKSLKSLREKKENRTE